MNQEQPSEKPSISFERATSADVEAFIELERKVAGSRIYSPSLAEEEALGEIGNVTYLLKMENKVAGSITYQIKDQDTAYISGLVVDPEHQGRGIARRALEHTLEELKDKKRIELVTHPENTRAFDLYLSLGFKAGQTRENFYGDGEPRTVLIMER